MHKPLHIKSIYYILPAFTLLIIGFAFTLWQNYDFRLHAIAIDPIQGEDLARHFVAQNWFITITFSSCGAIFLYMFYRAHYRQNLDISRKDNLIERNALDVEFQLAKRTLELLATETKLKTLVNATPVILWTTNLDLRFTVSEGSGLQGLGLKPNEVVGRTVPDIYADYPGIIDHHVLALRGTSTTAKVKIGPTTFACQFAPLRDADGAIIGVIGVALDISTLEQATERLQQHEKQLFELVEYLPDGVVVSVDQTIKYANQSAAKLAGAQPADIIGKSLLDFVHPDFKGIVRERMDRLAMGQNVPLIPCRLMRLDGTSIDAEVKSRPFVFGKNFGILTSFNDVTQKNQLEKSMRRSNVLLKSLVNNSPLALVSLDKSSLVQTWNHAAERLFGWRVSETVGKPCPFIPEDLRTEMAGTVKRLLAGQPTAPFDINLRKQDGSLQRCHLMPATIREDNGEISGCFAFVMPSDKI